MEFICHYFIPNMYKGVQRLSRFNGCHSVSIYLRILWHNKDSAEGVISVTDSTAYLIVSLRNGFGGHSMPLGHSFHGISW